MKTFKVVVEINADFDSVKAWNRAMIDLVAKNAIRSPTSGNWFTLGFDLLKQRIFRKKYEAAIFKDREWISLDEAMQGLSNSQANQSQ